MKIILMEHFNSILFHKPRLANKQQTSQSINEGWGITSGDERLDKVAGVGMKLQIWYPWMAKGDGAFDE